MLALLALAADVLHLLRLLLLLFLLLLRLLGLLLLGLRGLGTSAQLSSVTGPPPTERTVASHVTKAALALRKVSG